MNAKLLRAKAIVRIENLQRRCALADPVAVEEPLEIRVGGRSVAVVMRTPGHDRELAAGFLVSEGLLRRRDDVLDLVFCAEATTARKPKSARAAKGRGGRSRPPSSAVAMETIAATSSEAGSAGADSNIVDVILAPMAKVDLTRLTRHVFTSSSCGICSKASIEAVRAQFAPLSPAPVAPRASVIAALPESLRAAQPAFAATGGLHASALFDADGRLVLVREDVGRHNALDKVIGHAFLADALPLTGRILLVSGRVSFEIMQKALAAGIGCVAAISAPTTAAVEFAVANGQTLIGFVREDRMNVYAGTLAG